MIIVCCLLFSGCQTATSEPAVMPTYQALISDYSDSIDGVITAREYNMQTEPDETDPPPADTWTITFNGTTYTGTYYKSYNYTGETTHKYMHSRDIGFQIDSEGNLLEFSNTHLSQYEASGELGDALSADACKQIAADVFSQYADLAKYTIQMSPLQNDRYYMVSFIRILPGDIYTREFCNVYVLADGRVYWFAGSNLGMFPDDIQTDDLSKDAAYAAMETRLDELLASKKDAYASMEYVYSNLDLIILKDGRRAFTCFATVKCYNESGVEVYGYIFEFVIPVS